MTEPEGSQYRSTRRLKSDVYNLSLESISKKPDGFNLDEMMVIYKHLLTLFVAILPNATASLFRDQTWGSRVAVST